MLSAIVAMDKKGAIGKQGSIPWHLPDDFKQFKEYTVDKAILMGYNTAVSIGRKLPHRTNIVLSRNHMAPFPGQIHFENNWLVGEYRKLNEGQEMVVCGGASVYKEYLWACSQLIVTEVDTIVEGADTFFPYTADELSKHGRWVETSTIHHEIDERHKYAFTVRTFKQVMQKVPPLSPAQVGEDVDPTNLVFFKPEAFNPF